MTNQTIQQDNSKEAATSETSDVIGKRKLLVDTNAKAGNRTQEIDGYGIDHDDGSIDFGKLIRCTKTGELCLTGV